jgi:hypothetical protein
MAYEGYLFAEGYRVAQQQTIPPKADYQSRKWTPGSHNAALDALKQRFA